ncbi:secernin-2 [Scaptodrosophila lebanonensis]|uniref:Secernin-2 n=1 Tax=Drosophila lebanonensis TaxID=7225 RepID=A0A6J2TGH1_DROLE|nr:secernin-2 [Scaptodrosophila lebanonensis]
MSSNGDCFLVLPDSCANDCLIVGRNNEDETALGVSQEVCYYDVSEVLEGKTAGGGDSTKLCVILQKPKPGVWGGDFGANERNVVVGLTWSTGEESSEDGLLGTDIVRMTLAQSESAESAVEQIGELVTKESSDAAKLNFIVCDATGAWLVSCAGKVWAAEKVKAGHLRVPSGGLTVTTTIDKSSDGLDAAANFAAAHDAETTPLAWCGPEPNGDAKYTLPDMFETLRSASNAASSRAACISVLSAKGISCHWFTATPNASESVFKPFVFAPAPRVSPLTKVQAEADVTLLHKLHSQRKPAALEHLRSLEASCVEELNNLFGLQDQPTEELDELLKDCVEAEVKFYR